MRIWDAGLLDRLNIKVRPQICPYCNNDELNIGIKSGGVAPNSDLLYISCRNSSCGLTIERPASRDTNWNVYQLANMIQTWNKISFKD